MKHRIRAALATGATILLVVGLNPPTASADTSQPSLIALRPSSDPKTSVCYNRENGVDVEYWCMYTSNDLPIHDNANYFPMDSTYVYTYNPASGLNPGDPASWASHLSGAAAFNENQLPFANPGKHLWAPTRGSSNTPGETLLYVPDANTNIIMPGTSETGVVAYIAVARSYGRSPWGPFGYEKNITYNGTNTQLTYMSDPAVATLADTHPVIDNAFVDANGIVQYPEDYHPAGGPATWLVWANGDFNNSAVHANCGTLGIGRLKDYDLTDLADDPGIDDNPARSGWPLSGPTDIVINGITQQLGACATVDPDPNSHVPPVFANHPYLEGPELYDLAQLTDATHQWQGDRFMLMFSAKPEHQFMDANGFVHDSVWGSQHPGVDGYQVLAWASSNNPRGPYTYRGILMDSSTTSWTNHGSILFDHPNGQLRMILFYHDETMNPGPPGTQGQSYHERKSRAACLSYSISAGNFATVPRPTAVPNLTTCTGYVA